jgi:hypothetical protein
LVFNSLTFLLFFSTLIDWGLARRIRRTTDLRRRGMGWP